MMGSLSPSCSLIILVLSLMAPIGIKIDVILFVSNNFILSFAYNIFPFWSREKLFIVYYVSLLRLPKENVADLVI